MELQISKELQETIKAYHLPRYAEIPSVGLYLNQVARYINEYMQPFYDMDITESMISNYVKKHLVSSPEKKQYSREQIAFLIFIAIAKSVLSMDNISIMLNLQKGSYDSVKAYDYFCNEFEDVLSFTFGIKKNIEDLGEDADETKLLFRNVIMTVSHKLYIDLCFSNIKSDQTSEDK